MASKCLLFLLLLTGKVIANVNMMMENNVWVLDNDSNEAVTKEHDDVVVLFYSPDCPFSRKLMPEYEKAAAIMKAENSSVIFAKIDDPRYRKLGDKYHFKGYPSVLLLQSGDYTTFEGNRTAEAIVQWVKNHTDTPVTGSHTTFTVYDDIDFKGESKKLILNGEECRSFGRFKARIRSVDTKGQCIRFFYANNCAAAWRDVSPSSTFSPANLDDVRYKQYPEWVIKNNARSYRSC